VQNIGDQVASSGQHPFTLSDLRVSQMTPYNRAMEETKITPPRASRNLRRVADPRFYRFLFSHAKDRAIYLCRLHARSIAISQQWTEEEN